MAKPDERGKSAGPGRAKKRRPAGWAAFTDGGAVPAWVTAARLVLVAAYAAAIPTILGVEHGRRLLWTVAIASLPLFWVLGGYHLWRRICPLAVFGQLGRLVGRPGERKLGGRLAEHYLLVQLGLMVAALSLRLVATNGGAAHLAGFLAAVTLTAVVVSFVYTGKTWCNYLCPVGMVEKIYTEPARLGGQGSSQCTPCTACKKHCPDIDLEQGYWKEMGERSRRVAYFAWPGVVLGFYLYYYLVSGGWDYYFSGSWTYESGQPGRWLDPGFTFLPAVPVAAAAPLTLIGLGAASFAVLAAGERLILRLHARGGAPLTDETRQRVRHRALVLAGFVAFNTFYFFGGQPTLRELPGWAVHGFGVAVVFSSAAIFFRRWSRSERDHVQERFAQKILKRWEWGEEPASDRLQDIYLLHTERSKQREARMRAYKETVREMVADGLVTRGELALLDNLRAQLGVSDKDHERLLAELSDEERQLFDPEYQGSVERRLQQEQYGRELQRAVLAAAHAGRPVTAAALSAVRTEHGVPAEEHAEVLAQILAENGPVVALYRDELGAVAAFAAAAAAARGGAADADSASLALVAQVCQWRGRQLVDHALALLAAVADTDAVTAARDGAAARDPERRAEAARALAAAAPAPLIEPLLAAIERLAGDGALPLAAEPMLAVVRDSSPYVRAAVALLLSRFDDERARAALLEASSDEAALVREAAFRALGARGRLTRELMAQALGDGDARVRQAAIRTVAGASAEMVAVPDPEALAGTVPGAGGQDTELYATLDVNARIESLTTIEKMMLLRNVPMFAELDPDDLEELTGIAEERRFAAGEVLCTEGEPGADVFLLIRGAVRVFVGGGDRPERALSELGPGACIGEMSAFDASPRSATVAATARTRTLVLPGREFKALLLARPAIAQGILAELVARMRTMIAAGGAPSPAASAEDSP